MNGHAAKAIRRDMRRAMGMQAVEEVESQTQAIHRLHAQLEVQRVALAAHDTALGVLDKAVNTERTHRLAMADDQRGYVDNEDRQLRTRLNEHLRLNFWQRLRWLIRGV